MNQVLEAEKYGMYVLMKRIHEEALDQTDVANELKRMYSGEKAQTDALATRVRQIAEHSQNEKLILKQKINTETESRDSLLAQQVSQKN